MIRAAGKRLVVREVVSEEKSPKGVLILPNKKEQYVAQVIAKGYEVDECIDSGDMVALPNDSGIPIEINGMPFLSIVENQILAVWDEVEEWEEL